MERMNVKENKPTDPVEEMKQMAGEKAVEYIEEGTIVGLGTGSTVYYTIMKLGEKVRNGFKVQAIPTSIQTEKLAIEQGIHLLDLSELDSIDLTIDGADEVDPDFNLVKGMGGALVREKIVASMSKKEIIIVDDSKLVEKLGTKSPLPVEVVQFGTSFLIDKLSAFGCEPVLRMRNDRPMLSDNKNHIIDCRFSEIGNPVKLDTDICRLPGVIDTGLFVGLTDMVIVAGREGVKVLEKD